MNRTIPHAVAMTLATAFFVYSPVRVHAQMLSMADSPRVMVSSGVSQHQDQTDTDTQPAGFTTLQSHLYRVKDLFDGDARALWVGDSWSLFNNIHRLPYGSLMVWPIGDLQAVCAGFRTSGPAKGVDFTSGLGALTPVDSAHGWIAETNNGVPNRIALPINNMTRVEGDSGLVLDTTWLNLPRIQSLRIDNTSISRGNLLSFTDANSHVLVRPLYYSPLHIDDQLSSVVFADQDGTVLDVASLRDGARPFWSKGENPDTDPPRIPVAEQINALAHDLPLSALLDNGPELVIGQDNANPLIGSLDDWFFAGAVYYLTDAQGQRLPGYYHSVLSTISWQIHNFGTNEKSTGNKQFTDEQLLHWLDVTTLDRNQQPIVILHIATERLDQVTVHDQVLMIINRFRDAFAAIGTLPPRFLLLGSYMHRTQQVFDPADRGYVEELNRAYLSLAQSEPDCAFFSLYAATDGTYFTSDDIGGPGTQQAARDWLDSHGWSTITYGGTTYNLSSAANNGLDGILTVDGLHMGSTPAAAFMAKLIGDAIEASHCPADFNNDNQANTQDVIAFLNAWSSQDPSADINGDGLINTKDVIAFLNDWNAGC